jgi:hypothetical protein
MIKLCRVLVVVSCGLPKDDGAVDTFALRESQSVELLQDVSTIITETQSKVQFRNEATPLSRRVEDVCELLPDYLVSLFGLVEMTGKLFALMSWGKRKQHTKAAPSALAGVAKALGSWAHIMRDILLTRYVSDLIAHPFSYRYSKTAFAVATSKYSSKKYLYSIFVS